MKQIIAIFTLLTTSYITHAQSAYSLRGAIEFSLQNHASNNIYLNDVRKAQAQSREALSAYLPQVNANGTFDDNLRRQTTVLPGAMFGRNEDIPVQLGTKYNANAVVQLDQTIYDQALIYGLKAGLPAKLIAELNLAKNREELIYNTVTAYTQILVLKEQQKLLTASKKQYDELYSTTKFRFDKGVAKKIDLDKVTVQRNNIAAKLRQIDADIEVAQNTLKNAMGLPADSKLQIADSINTNQFTIIPDASFDVNQLIDFKLQQQNIAFQEIDVKRKEAASLPTLSGYIRYGQQSFNNDFSASLTNWNTFAAMGVKLNVPIFSGTRRTSQLQQSKIELENARTSMTLNTEKLNLQFQNAARLLKENINTVSANKENMELAKSVYSTSQFEYSKGVTTMTDLLNADFAYRQAQTDYVSALLNLVTNRLNFEKAKGNITDFVNKL